MRCFKWIALARWSMGAGWLAAHAVALALDAGRHGPVYAIREPDFLKEVKGTVQAKVDSGEWKRIEAEARRRTQDQLTHPPPVAGIRVAAARRSWLHDPSIVLSEDVRDSEGRVMYPAGTRVNPLDVVALPQPMLFFDGGDLRQVKAAQAVMARHDGRVTPILVAGSWQKLGRDWKRQVYFDQGGRLVRQLGIHAVPAVVTQELSALRIEEFVP